MSGRICPWIIGILVVIIVVIIGFRPERRDVVPTDGGITPPPTAAEHAHLILEHREAVDWIDFSNDVDASVDREKCDATSNAWYRPGVLFQIGTRSVAVTYVYDEIRIYRTGVGEPEKLETWCWVNIVSAFEGRPDPPIDPNLAFALYPNSSPTISATSCPAIGADPCQRNRRIKGSMEEVRALMTYWQGPKGYSVSAKQEFDECYGNTFRFTFHDQFRVEVYQPAAPATDASMGTPTIYEPGTVDSIVVAVTPGPPERGQIQDPAWPYP